MVYNKIKPLSFLDSEEEDKRLSVFTIYGYGGHLV